jgi:hypothetical protein
MSGYKNFAVVGAGVIGSFIIGQLLADKAAGTVDNVVVLTRQASGLLASESACQTPFTNQSPSSYLIRPNVMRSGTPRDTIQKPGPKREHATYVMCGRTGYLAAVVSC